MTTDTQDPQLFGQTPSQTVGPFCHIGLPWAGGADLISQSAVGARPDLVPPDHFMLRRAPARGPVRGSVIEISGQVLDGDNRPVPDAMLEIWQANAFGRYCSPDDKREDIALDR